MDAAPPSRGPDQPLKILCVEDKDPDFELVKEYLWMAPGAPPLEVRRARDIQDACAQLRAAHNGSQFDIILTDLSLPDSQGEETFRLLREAAPDVPVTVMTGLEDDALGLGLVKIGAQDYLPKDQLGPMYLLRSLLHAIERERIQVEMQRLNRELKSAQMQLIQAEKLQSLGRLSAGVAHEIKNPLAMLQACADYYRFKGAASPEEETILATMQEAIQRASRIVSAMLDFSRDEKLDLRKDDLNAVADNSIKLIEHDLRTSGIELVRLFTPRLPPVKIDQTKIEQILVNLLINALHASTAGAKVKIKTYAGEINNLVPDEGLRSLAHLRHGDRVVVVEVRDYGPGIPDNILAKIFDPFFTTKATGKGTGLGLSVSKIITELHGGALWIRNAEPSGVCAQVILPRH